MPSPLDQCKTVRFLEAGYPWEAATGSHEAPCSLARAHSEMPRLAVEHTLAFACLWTLSFAVVKKMALLLLLLVVMMAAVALAEQGWGPLWQLLHLFL